MKVGIYERVSTSEQDTGSQRYAVDQWLAKRGITEVRTFTDLGISGKTDKRPAFQALLAAVELGEIDTVVTFRLDRLSRKATTALTLLLDWIKKDVQFFAVDQAVLHLGKDNPMRLTIAAMFSELAQLERDALISRVKAGIAAAQARGVKFGATSKLSAAQRVQIKKLVAAGKPMRSIGAQFGVSAATICRVK